jgi:hypothetical protein
MDFWWEHPAKRSAIIGLSVSIRVHPWSKLSGTGRTLQRRLKKPKSGQKSGMEQVPALISELFLDKNYRNDSFFVRNHSKITGHTGC